MDDKLDLAEIAKIAKNYTGAELEAVVRYVVALAMNRGTTDLKDVTKQLTLKSTMKITKSDFL